MMPCRVSGLVYISSSFSKNGLANNICTCSPGKQVNQVPFRVICGSFLKTYLELARNDGQCSGIQVGRGEDFVQLSFLLLQRVVKSLQLLLQEQILEISLLLHFVYGLVKGDMNDYVNDYLYK